MTTLPPSASERASSSFDLLSDPIRRWIWQQGWEELRDIQEKSIPVILKGNRDVIIAAATASGKTEAAFLPILSRIVNRTVETPGFKAVYISPLKALINDQFRRLDQLCESLEIPVHRWHGDVSSSAKARARARPDGVLLITPESLEATFVRRGLDMARLFAATSHLVIDEIHAFIGAERGMQLQSLLHRLEAVLGRRVCRIGLSATLGNMRLAASFLRPGSPEHVDILESKSDGQELRVQIRGYIEAATRSDADKASALSSDEDRGSDADEDHDLAVRQAITDHIFKRLRGTHNLIFAGSRQNVELYSDRLRRASEDLGLPNEFYPHHSNLSKQHREFVEERMRKESLPTSAVCTSTLELGIDIGDIENVAQIGAPWSVAGLRQRLGRSGRRKDQPAILRMYIAEKELHADIHPIDTLRCDLVQAIAMIRLLVNGWCEPSQHRGLHLSTLLHQVLALISQYGGITAGQAYNLLCHSGPFSAVSESVFANLLRGMGSGENRLIEQAPDGTLLLGEDGERLVESYHFYTVFTTHEEYRIVTKSKDLGTVPIENILSPGMTIIFAGQRWTIQEIDDRRKIILVEPASAGTPPWFGGQGGDIHDRVVSEMRAIYREESVPSYLDAKAQTLLGEARREFHRLELHDRSIIRTGGTVFLLAWVGTIKIDTLVLALREAGLDASARGIAIEVSACEPEDVTVVLNALASSPPPEPLALAKAAANRMRQKYDSYLPEQLLALSFASARIDGEALPALAGKLLSGEGM